MKLAVVIVSAAMIAFGFLWRDSHFVLVGAVIHLLCGIADLFHAYRDAKLLRSGTLSPETSSLHVRVARWIEGGITLTGLILVVANKKSSTGYYAASGWIIWGGAIICYIASGLIGREVGGIPLRMGYGGWRVRRDRNGHPRK